MFRLAQVIEVGLGDSFALMSAITASIWAGVYELGRTQQKGYRLTREEQDEMDLLAVDFQSTFLTPSALGPRP
jgi:hypothetical protein